MNGFQQYIRDSRERKGMSLAEAAQEIGCSEVYLLGLESGRENNPTIKTLVCITNALGLSLNRLTRLAADNCATV